LTLPLGVHGIHQLANRDALAMQHHALYLDAMFLHPLLATPLFEPFPGVYWIVCARAAPITFAVHAHTGVNRAPFSVKTFANAFEYR
jgi:glyoxylate carboligase